VDITKQKNKNQRDYISLLVDKQLRNGIRNGKAMRGANCESDHNPVVVTMKIRLQRIKKFKKTKKFNVSKVEKPEIKNDYRMRLDKELEADKFDEWMEVDEIWNKLKEGIGTFAEEICGKEQMSTKQIWMNTEILQKMEERRKCKIRNKEGQYRKLKHEIQKAMP
jgi:hypothetical protein